MTKFYVNDTNKTTIVCPKCGYAKVIDTSNFKATQKRLKANCKCGEVFKFTLEFRKHYRKDVRLPGEYSIPRSREKGEIVVHNLSLSGVQFTCFRQHQILPDDTLELKFNLDNSARTEIRRSAKVMWVRERDVGVQFIGQKSSERDLSFYLRP